LATAGQWFPVRNLWWARAIQLLLEATVQSFWVVPRSDVTTWPWSFRAKSKSLAWALAVIPQVFGLGLDGGPWLWGPQMLASAGVLLLMHVIVILNVNMRIRLLTLMTLLT